LKVLLLWPHLLAAADARKVQGYLADKNTPFLGPYSRTIPRVIW